MKNSAYAVASIVALFAAPLLAQDGDGGMGEVVVTAQRISNNMANVPVGIFQPPSPPVIGLKRQADSAVRNIEIVSDSREEAMRKREVQAMLLDAIDRAKQGGFSLLPVGLNWSRLRVPTGRTSFPNLPVKPATTKTKILTTMTMAAAPPMKMMAEPPPSACGSKQGSTDPSVMPSRKYRASSKACLQPGAR